MLPVSHRSHTHTLGHMQWMSSDGQWIVSLIQLTATGTGRDGAWLRVTHHGIYI
jgi:hypothetical protein